jgi:hypothetical protein
VLPSMTRVTVPRATSALPHGGIAACCADADMQPLAAAIATAKTPTHRRLIGTKPKAGIRRYCGVVAVSAL